MAAVDTVKAKRIAVLLTAPSKVVTSSLSRAVWLKRSDLIKGLPDLPKRSNAACFEMLSPVIN